MKLAACLTLAALSAAGGASAEIRVEELVAQNRYVLEFDGKRLSGPGWDFLLAATTDAQFIGVSATRVAAHIGWKPAQLAGARPPTGKRRLTAESLANYLSSHPSGQALHKKALVNLGEERLR